MPSRQSLRRRHRQSPLVVALYLNAALLACVLTALLSRDSRSAAMAADPAVPQPIAGGNGLYLMPGQFATNLWGCYVMDVNRQTLSAYEYIPGRRQLQLVASRYFANDVQLRAFNTVPDPEEVKRLVDLQNAPVRGQGDGQPGDRRLDGPIPQPPLPGPQTTPTGERPLDRPPQEGDKDFVPTPRDINPPGE